MKQILVRPTLGPLVAGLAVVACLAMALWVPRETLEAWTAEGAFFEAGSVVGWWVGALLCIGLLRSEPRFYALTAALLLLAGARELDWHKAFTTDSVLKTNYYLETVAPLGEKLLAAGFVVLVAIMVAYYLRAYLPDLWRGLRARRAAAVTAATVIALLVFTKTFDRVPNQLKDDYGLVVPDWVWHLQLAMEEPLEFVIPLLVIVAIVQGRMSAR